MLCQKHGKDNCSNYRCVELRKEDWYKEICPEHGLNNCKCSGVTLTGSDLVSSTVPPIVPIVYSPGDLVEMSKDDLSKIAIMRGLEWESALNKEELVKLVLGGQ